MAQYFVQDPNESIEYQLLWTGVLPDGATIVQSTWEGDDDLEISDEAQDGDYTAAFVRAANPLTISGQRPMLTNTVELTNNEHYSESIFIAFEEK